MKARTIALTLALSAAIAAQASAGGNCDEYFRIRHIDQDRDGNTTYHVSLTAFAQDYQTDTTIVELGRCYAALISTAPCMGAVEADGQHIDIDAAREMSEF